MPGAMITRTPVRIFDKLTGINNVDDPKRISPSELQAASNIDLDDAGKPSRKKGYTLWKAGAYKWGWSDGIICLAVRNQNLVGLDTSGNEVIIRNLSSDSRVVYEKIHNRVYYTNGYAIGYVVGGTNFLLTVPDKWDGSSNAFKRTMPAGNFLAYSAGRLFSAKGNVLTFSDPGFWDQYDRRFNFRQLSGSFTLLEAVGDGIFLADQNGTYFWKTKDADLLGPDKLIQLCDYGAIPYAVATVDGSLIIKGKTLTGKIKLWATNMGICAGTDGGIFENLTLQKYEIAEGYNGSALHRINHRGTSQVIFTINR